MIMKQKLFEQQTAILTKMQTKGYNVVECGNCSGMYVPETERTVTYHRAPTKGEIRFGHGATHYLDVNVSKVTKPDGTLKKWFIHTDGLRYTDKLNNLIIINMKTKKQINESTFVKRGGYTYNFKCGSFEGDSTSGRVLKHDDCGYSKDIGVAYNKKEFVSVIYEFINDIHPFK